jgi:hypothetical protein
MPLAPGPIFPGLSPLPPAGARPPAPSAMRLAALVAVPVLLTLLVLGQVTLPWVAFFGPGLEAQAGGRDPSSTTGAAPFQGFVYWWTRRMTVDPSTGGVGGYNSAASYANLKLQADTFHMNTVIIPVVADMPYRSDSILAWNQNDTTSWQYDKDTFSAVTTATTPNAADAQDAVYEQVVSDARKAGLLPILELVVRQQAQVSRLASGQIDESSELVGRAWDIQSQLSYGAEKGGRLNVRDTERAWFDAYTAFAVHYAALSGRLNLPYFIIGDQLSSVSFDTAHTDKQHDPLGIDTGLGSDPFATTCTGRRDCGWRHVINAIKSANYGPYIIVDKTKPTLLGASYGGKLIYAANWGPADQPEYDRITWWDAVDYIGIDAYYPLSVGLSDIGVPALVDIWHGRGDNPSQSGDIYTDLGTLADKYHHPILFTSAAYESTVGANASPGNTPTSDVDETEQLDDMEALLVTFNTAPWWTGVFWYGEQPITPHSAQANWENSTNWAGDTLDKSKLAGQWLAHYYAPQPPPCGC